MSKRRLNGEELFRKVVEIPMPPGAAVPPPSRATLEAKIDRLTALLKERSPE